MSKPDQTGRRPEYTVRIIKAGANPPRSTSDEIAREAAPTAKIIRLSDRIGDHEEIKRSTAPRHPGYSSWAAMKQRCNNPNNCHYADYGGRGISYCRNWEEFRQFISDMGSPPAPNFTLERLDVEGDYCPENCEWASPRTQARNRRSNRYVTYRGEQYTLAELAQLHNLRPSTLSARLKARGSIEAALSCPVQRGGVRRPAAPWAAYDRWPSSLRPATKNGLEENYGFRKESEQYSRPKYFLDRYSGSDNFGVLFANPDEVGDTHEFYLAKKLIEACAEASQLYVSIRNLKAQHYSNAVRGHWERS